MRTHAACTSTLVALRPPLRVCEPPSSRSRSWPSAVARLRVAAEGRRPSDAMRLSSSITSRAPIDSAAWVNNPDHPSLNSTRGCPAPTAILPFSVVVLLRHARISRADRRRGGCHARPFFLVRLAPPYTASTRVGGGAITTATPCQSPSAICERLRAPHTCPPHQLGAARSCTPHLYVWV